MAKIEPFEKHLDRYEDWFVRNRWAYYSELQAVKELLPESEPGVEIGVGSGLFAQPLGIKIGIEPSSRMAQLARQRGIEVIKGVAENLPLKDNRFTFALMVTTICFLDDIERAFKEIKRILKNGGYFIIGFVDKNSTIGQQYEKFKEQNLFYRFATFYSVSELIHLLEKTGFAEFSFRQTIFKSLELIKEKESVKEGYGRGAFVVVRARA